MRGCRGEGVAGKGKINRGRGRGVAAEVLLELLVCARRREGQGLEAIGVSETGGSGGFGRGG